jgi:hypothetical protein
VAKQSQEQLTPSAAAALRALTDEFVEDVTRRALRGRRDQDQLSASDIVSAFESVTVSSTESRRRWRLMLLLTTNIVFIAAVSVASAYFGLVTGSPNLSRSSTLSIAIAATTAGMILITAALALALLASERKTALSLERVSTTTAPSIEFLQAWLALEGSIRSRVSRRDEEVPTAELGTLLVEDQVLSADEKEAFSELQRLRNNLVHRGELLAPSRSATAIATTNRLRAAIESRPATAREQVRQR